MNVQALRRTAERKGQYLSAPDRLTGTARTQLAKWSAHGTGASRR